MILLFSFQALSQDTKTLPSLFCVCLPRTYFIAALFNCDLPGHKSSLSSHASVSILTWLPLRGGEKLRWVVYPHYVAAPFSPTPKRPDGARSRTLSHTGITLLRVGGWGWVCVYVCDPAPAAPSINHLGLGQAWRPPGIPGTWPQTPHTAPASWHFKGLLGGPSWRPSFGERADTGLGARPANAYKPEVYTSLKIQSLISMRPLEKHLLVWLMAL